MNPFGCDGYGIHVLDAVCWLDWPTEACRFNDVVLSQDEQDPLSPVLNEPRRVERTTRVRLYRVWIVTCYHKRNLA